MVNDFKVFQYNTAYSIWFVLYTDWFPADVKPVHQGWYECELCSYMWWWNGEFWSMRQDDSSMLYADQPCGDQNRVWRGLYVNVQGLN